MKKFLVAGLLFFKASALATDTPGHQFTRYAGFQLGKGTLADVIDRLGPTQRHERGDAGEFEAWVCYRTSFGEVQFNSGEIGGGTELIGFTLSNKSLTNNCGGASVVLDPKIANVRLGMSKSDFETAVGESIVWKNRSGTVSFSYPTPNGYDVSISVIADFDRNRLVKLVVWKTETN